MEKPDNKFEMTVDLNVLEHLMAHPSWHAKPDIITASGITNGQWNTAINELIASGRVERQGERRGARYRII